MMEVPEVSHAHPAQHRSTFSDLPPGQGAGCDDLGRQLLIVATDRISAFDCVMPEGIPDKGRILTAVAAYWFAATEDLVPNHFRGNLEWPADLEAYRETLAGRAVIVEKTHPLPVECVVRGYLAGSGWKEYQSDGAVCGVPLPSGLRLADRLPEPIFTPATKAEEGHDENISFERMAEIVGGEQATRLRDLSLVLYPPGAPNWPPAAASCWRIPNSSSEPVPAGELILIDEALTPDSSRYWLADTWAPGKPAKPRQAVSPGLPRNAGDLGQAAAGTPPSTGDRRRDPGPLPGSGRPLRSHGLVSIFRSSGSPEAPIRKFAGSSQFRKPVFNASRERAINRSSGHPAPRAPARARSIWASGWRESRLRRAGPGDPGTIQIGLRKAVPPNASSRSRKRDHTTEPEVPASPSKVAIRPPSSITTCTGSKFASPGTMRFNKAAAPARGPPAWRPVPEPASLPPDRGF